MLRDIICDCLIFYNVCESVGDFVVKMRLEVVVFIILYGLVLMFGFYVVYMVEGV